MNFEVETLAGRVIAVPESRELDVFAALLERRGATTLRCPLIAIHDAPDPLPILHWVEDFIARRYDDLVLLTGEGLRRLLSCVDKHSPHLREPFIAAVANARKITRGPKPARALKEIGLRSDLAAEPATTEGVIASLSHQDLRNRRVGVQLYGTDPNRRLIDWLRAAGAEAFTVSPYVYADAAEDQAVLSLAEKLLAKQIDAIAFTSMQQVQRFFDLLGDTRAHAALANTVVAAVGPVVAESLAKRGTRVDVVPDGAFFLKPLTRALEVRLGTKS